MYAIYAKYLPTKPPTENEILQEIIYYNFNDLTIFVTLNGK